MNNYRNNIKNMYRETRFSIPFSNTRIKKRIAINKPGLSHEIETALSNSTNSSRFLTVNSKFNIKVNNNENNKSISNYKNNIIRPISPYYKVYNSDIDDNTNVYDETSLSFGNMFGLKSFTPDFDENSFFFRKANGVNVIRKAKSLDIVNATVDINTIKDIKTDFDISNEVKGLSHQYMEPVENEFLEEEIIPIEKNEKSSLLIKQQLELSEGLKYFKKEDLEIPKQKQPSLSKLPLIETKEQSIKQSIHSLPVNVMKENKKELNYNNLSSLSPSLESSSAEQILLQFVALDEQEKIFLQQIIIDQTTQRLNEQQQEADRLSNKINQQKVKLEEHKALQKQLSHELDIKRSQSVELQHKLSSQFEKNRKQRKELDYYKEMNNKYIKENRFLQQQIRELTKKKFSRLK